MIRLKKKFRNYYEKVSKDDLILLCRDVDKGLGKNDIILDRGDITIGLSIKQIEREVVKKGGGVGAGEK